MSQIQTEDAVFTGHTQPPPASVRRVLLPPRFIWRLAVLLAAWVVCIPLTVALSELIANAAIAAALPAREDLRVYGRDAIHFAPGLLLICCVVFPLLALVQSRSWWPFHPFFDRVAAWAIAGLAFSFAPFFFMETRFRAYSSLDLLNDGSFFIGGAIAGCVFYLLTRRRRLSGRGRNIPS